MFSQKNFSTSRKKRPPKQEVRDRNKTQRRSENEACAEYSPCRPKEEKTERRAQNKKLNEAESKNGKESSRPDRAYRQRQTSRKPRRRAERHRRSALRSTRRPKRCGKAIRSGAAAKRAALHRTSRADRRRPAKAKLSAGAATDVATNSLDPDSIVNKKEKSAAQQNDIKAAASTLHLNITITNFFKIVKFFTPR